MHPVFRPKHLGLIGLALMGIAASGHDLRLVEAAKNADTTAIRGLLKQRVDVNTRGGDGTTAFHWVAYWDDEDAADLLVHAGADVNAVTDLGATPLWAACENASAGMVRRLLKAGANPNAKLLSGETPLMTAARTGNAEVVNLLLGAGADVNVTEHAQNQTALMWAVSQQHVGIVEQLVSHGADVHARSTAWPQKVQTTPELFNPPYIRDIMQGGYTPLLFAARGGGLASAKVLIAGGADVNETAPSGTSAVVVAAHSGHGALAAFLLEKGADPNAAGAGYTALHAAILHKDDTLVAALLDRGADPNAPIRNGTPTRRGSRDLYLNPSFAGATPFWLAARLNAPKIMRLLAKRGADPLFVHHMAYWKTNVDRTQRVDEGDTTALMAAAGMGDRLYRGRGEGESDAGESEGLTLEAVTVAAELGVDPNVANADGNTALHTVAARGFNTVVKFLVEKGARLDITNKKGQTPLALAQMGRASRRGTAELLRQLGAKE